MEIKTILQDFVFVLWPSTICGLKGFTDKPLIAAEGETSLNGSGLHQFALQYTCHYVK